MRTARRRERTRIAFARTLATHPRGPVRAACSRTAGEVRSRVRGEDSMDLPKHRTVSTQRRTGRAWRLRGARVHALAPARLLAPARSLASARSLALASLLAPALLLTLSLVPACTVQQPPPSPLEPYATATLTAGV